MNGTKLGGLKGCATESPKHTHQYQNTDPRSAPMVLGVSKIPVQSLTRVRNTQTSTKKPIQDRRQMSRGSQRSLTIQHHNITSESPKRTPAQKSQSKTGVKCAGGLKDLSQSRKASTESTLKIQLSTSSPGPRSPHDATAMATEMVKEHRKGTNCTGTHETINGQPHVGLVCEQMTGWERPGARQAAIKPGIPVGPWDQTFPMRPAAGTRC